MNDDLRGYGFHAGDPMFYVAPLAQPGIYQGQITYGNRLWQQSFPTRIVMTGQDVFTSFDDVTVRTCGGTTHTYVRKEPRATAATPHSANVATGTCFSVAPDGLILTAYHLVKDANTITVRFENGDALPAVPEQVSAKNDLALLRVTRPTSRYLSLASQPSPKLGEMVFTLGFPAPSVLGAAPKFTEGTVSALSGPENESTVLQISVPIQPGNSGGPLVNYRGDVVGVITATAAILPFLQRTGSLPQNVNFAVKAGYASLLFTPPAALPPTTNRDEAIRRVRDALCTVKAIRDK